ncbi:baseplate J/gp47 family protein [Helicobacter sp. MIT 05-5294]|uniref:baseplate J/gp47 family protein n=1 Tax=Helicobacter sp. MIT 05-5294 TaxID=1548150 RepID=UPI00051FDFE7|nr:baseplate J/gp47 family protein [Helicobacter sp. MIT 05-5294]TLD85814.1 hypothetical protein LS69_007920 [Helicobacter sp. MIT 05-5294]
MNIVNEMGNPTYKPETKQDLKELVNSDSNLWELDRENRRIRFKYNNEILENVQDVFKQNFPNINMDESTPQGQIATFITQTINAGIGYLENIVNSFFFGGQGEFLDRWAFSLYRLERKKSCNSQVWVEIQGVKGTKIPANFIVGTLSGELYSTPNEYTIGDNGSVLGYFVAIENNDYVAGAREITEVKTRVIGVERVTNPEPALPAISEETDAEFYNRAVYFGSTAKNASFRAILANIAQTQGVKKIAGLENFTDKEIKKDGMTLAPHSICVSVLGGNDVDIAEAIRKSRSLGSGMNGNITINLANAYSVTPYQFLRPTPIPLYVKVYINKNYNFLPINFDQTIYTNLESFVEQCKIGAYITPVEAAEWIQAKTSGYVVDKCEIGVTSLNDCEAEPLKLRLDQYFTFDIANCMIIENTEPVQTFPDIEKQTIVVETGATFNTYIPVVMENFRVTTELPQGFALSQVDIQFAKDNQNKELVSQNKTYNYRGSVLDVYRIKV